MGASVARISRERRTLCWDRDPKADLLRIRVNRAASQCVLRSIVEVSVRTVAVACVLLVAALAGACNDPVRAPATDAGTVEVVAVAASSRSSEPGLVSVPQQGTSSGLKPGSRLGLPSTVKSLNGGARLRLDDRSALTLASHTTVAVFPTSPITVALENGTLAVDRPGDSKQALWLTIEGQTWVLPAGSSWVAARTGSDGGVLTVHRGEVTRSGPGDALRAGQTLRQKPSGNAGSPSPVRVPDESAPDSAGSGSFGRVVARVPGSDTQVSDVRVVSVRIRASVRSGMARTEIEQVLGNRAERELEANLTLPLPSRASLSRLSLWVGDRPMQGEIVEREQGVRWMRALVDATVPRDPALMHPQFGDSLMLRVFPMPAKGERRVSHVVETLLPVRDGIATLRIPLASGAPDPASVERLSLEVDLGTLADAASVRVVGAPANVVVAEGRTMVRFTSAPFKPVEDLVVSFPSPGNATWFVSDSVGARDAIFAHRFTASEPEPRAHPWHGDRVIVIDRSASQTVWSLRQQVTLVRALLERTEADERFAILACDRSCESFPPKGMVEAGEASLRSAMTWAEGIGSRGSTDLGGAIAAASQRLGEGKQGQLVVMADGIASAGMLWVDSISSQVERANRVAEVRLVGVGASVDDAALFALAARLGASYERMNEQTNPQDAALALRMPLIRSARLTVPDGVRDVRPTTWPSIRLGQQMVVVGRATARVTGSMVLHGKVGGEPYDSSTTPAWGDAAASGNPAVARLWASEAIRELEVTRDAASRREVISLSKRYHVLSRHTALIALDSEAQFARFGIARTNQRDGTDDFFGQSGEADESIQGRWVSGGRASPACCSPSDLICNMRAASQSRARRRFVGLSARFALSGDRGWRDEPGEKEKTLRAALAASPDQRDKLAALARSLLARAQFEEAARTADILVGLDPASRVGHELRANAWAGLGEGLRAADALDLEAELDPVDAWAHERAARAFEVVGEPHVACAHWRAAAELDSGDALAEAIRCRAVDSGDMEGALAEARSIARPTSRLRAVVAALEKDGKGPADNAGVPGTLDVVVECTTQSDCPVPIVLTPRGEVFSPWTPSLARSGEYRVGVDRLRRGTYRVLLVGGAAGHRGRLSVLALGRRHTLGLEAWADGASLEVTVH